MVFLLGDGQGFIRRASVAVQNLPAGFGVRRLIFEDD
jgi:hypothetical protein